MAGRPNLILRLALWAYALLWYLCLPLILFYLWRRGGADALYWQFLPERFGRHSSGLEGVIWVHAVSLGEMRSAVPMIRALLDRGEHVVTTHFTPAGRREAERVFASEIASGTLHSVWVPFEFGWAYARFFRAFRPCCGLVMEIEIWPGMIFAAQKAGVPLLMCNAQYPSKSIQRDAGGLRLRQGLMRGFTGALVKSDLQAERFAAVGVRNIIVTGELRFDQPIPTRQIRAGEEARKWLASTRDVIVITSVVDGEYVLYINIMRDVIKSYNDQEITSPLFVFIPRKPEMFSEVSKLIQSGGLSIAQRSKLFDENLNERGVAPKMDVLLGDSLGEMYFYLSMADKVITGGSFHPKGAHNVIEALALRKPVLVGPHIHTIEYPAVEAIADGVCLQVEDGAALTRALSPGGWSGPKEMAIEEFFAAHSGATARTMAALMPYLDRGARPF